MAREPSPLCPPAGAFVGRRAELAEIGRRLGANPLLVVTGPGGVGKTRLVLHYATEHADAYPGGVWFCDLTEAREPEEIASVVARALDAPLVQARETEEIDVHLARVLAARGRLLLVLDNFEQAAAHARVTVGAWRGAAPDAHFLVTSRERLRLTGEEVLPLAPLSLPPKGDEAAELLRERVRAGGGGQLLSDGDREAVDEIVRQLDGLPLAIELAAARIGVLTPSQILALLPTRFDLLTSAPRDKAARQRSLRATIDWSWNLLAPWEKAALEQLSVFRSGFFLEAAVDVVDLAASGDAPPTLDVLQALRDKSFLRTERRGSEARFHLYVSIREYAAEKLARDPSALAAARARHAAHYLRVGAEGAARLDGPDGLAALERLEIEQDNLVAVVEGAIARSGTEPAALSDAVAGVLALDAILVLRGPYALHMRLLDRVLRDARAAGVPAALCARALAARGKVRRMMGRIDEARRDHEDAIALASDDPVLESTLRTALGYLEMVHGRPEEAAKMYERALAALESRDEPRALGILYMNVGAFHHNRGENDEALERWERARDLAVQANDHRLSAGTLGNLANGYAHRGRAQEARACFEQSIELFRQLGYAHHEAVFIGNLARLVQDMGELGEASALYERSIEALHRLGDGRAGALFDVYRGTVLHEEGRVDAARHCYGGALPLLRKAQAPRNEAMTLGYLGAALAGMGRADEAERALDEAGRLLRAQQDRLGLAALEVHRGHADHAQGRAASVRERLAAARAFTGESLDVRLAVRLLERAVASSAPVTAGPRGGLQVGPEGAWFALPIRGAGGGAAVGGAPRHERVDVSRKRVLRRLLVALAEAHARAPGKALSLDQLFAAGWPGERIAAAASARRVYTAMGTLRDLGLRDVLVRGAGGYLLDPAIEVFVWAPAAEKFKRSS